MLPTLREREKRILFLLRLWQHKYRYSPSVTELAETFGVRRQTIQTVITTLKKKGYLELSEQRDWRHRQILFPKGTNFPWGNSQLPDELFDHMKENPSLEII